MQDEIKSESGTVLGQWDGRRAEDLMHELQRIIKILKANGSQEKLNPKDIPHRDQIPEDLIGFKAYRLWGCGLDNTCVVGSKADRLEPVEKVRTYSLIDHH